MTSQDLIKELQLLPHPEGGYYRETYRSEETTQNQKGNKRNVCTAIYFLLEGKDRSNFHRIQSDELWFFHQGDALNIYYIENNKLITMTLGNNLSKGELPFCRVPANSWFASSLKEAKGFSLVSCTVSPGFDFQDFELAQKETMLNEFPELEIIIKKHTIR